MLYVNSDIKGRVDAFKSTVESVEIGLKNQKYNSKSNKGIKDPLTSLYEHMESP
jgi:hypothetical protein